MPCELSPGIIQDEAQLQKLLSVRKGRENGLGEDRAKWNRLLAQMRMFQVEDVNKQSCQNRLFVNSEGPGYAGRWSIRL